jgi:uncharacterized protein YegP (UPF0339 family)
MTKGVHVLDVFQDEGGRWRWHIFAGNGRRIATSGEDFASKGNARRAARGMARLMFGSTVKVSR